MPITTGPHADDHNMALMLAMAGHDLRQPLQVAVLSLERASQHGLAAPSVGWLRTALDALQRLDSELSDIARVSQLGAGALLNVRPVEIDELMHRVERDWQRYAEACGVRLRVETSGIAVWSDPLMLHSIVRNLVGNAIRYSSAGDEVTVECQAAFDRVQLRVADEGCGIAAAQLDRIFEAFVRGDSRRQDAGLGLGLAIVRQMTEALGHPVKVESIEGVGSTFTVDLPLAR